MKGSAISRCSIAAIRVCGEVVMLMGPGTLGLAATQINLLVSTQLAVGQGTGAVSWLQYAFRLMNLPIGLFGVSIATAVLPAVARHAAIDDRPAVSRTIARGIALMLMVNVPASVGLFMLATPIVQLLLERGQFRQSRHPCHGRGRSVLCHRTRRLLGGPYCVAGLLCAAAQPCSRAAQHDLNSRQPGVERDPCPLAWVSRTGAGDVAGGHRSRRAVARSAATPARPDRRQSSGADVPEDRRGFGRHGVSSWPWQTANSSGGYLATGSAHRWLDCSSRSQPVLLRVALSARLLRIPEFDAVIDQVRKSARRAHHSVTSAVTTGVIRSKPYAAPRLSLRLVDHFWARSALTSAEGD